MLGPDSFRRTLGAALPWQIRGLGLLIAATVAPAIATLASLASVAAAIEPFARWLGWIGASSYVVGAIVASRARQAGRSTPWLAFAALFWGVEWLARTYAAFRPDAADAIAARALLASAAGLTQASGMLALLPPANHRVSRQHWRGVRAAFGVQLAAFAAIPLIGVLFGKPLSDWLDAPGTASGVLLAVLWIVFAGPHLALLLALRATRDGLRRKASVGELLLG